MGITQKSLDRINKVIHPADNILILGCQNLYNAENYGQLADDYYSMQGYPVRTIDITGCQGAEVADLRDDLMFDPDYSLILQHGTIEHVDGSLYQVLKNIHEACQDQGTMIHENPRTENWPGHGYHYFTTSFWETLAGSCNYDILDISEEPAMGNDVDGWNVCCVLRKSLDSKFISEEQFNKIYKKHIKSK